MSVATLNKAQTVKGVESGTILTYANAGSLKPLELRPEDICIEDIAHSLSQKVRYNGFGKRFYSVAEHCCHIFDYVKSLGCVVGAKAQWRGDLWDGSEVLSWCLLHDADEYVFVDLPAPIKHHPNGFGQAFIEESHKILEIVAERFNLHLPEPPIVKEIDLLLRANEMMNLFPDHDIEFQNDPLPGVEIKNWFNPQAEYQFLTRCQEVGLA